MAIRQSACRSRELRWGVSLEPRIASTHDNRAKTGAITSQSSTPSPPKPRPGTQQPKKVIRQITKLVHAIPQFNYAISNLVATTPELNADSRGSPAQKLENLTATDAISLGDGNWPLASPRSPNEWSKSMLRWRSLNRHVRQYPTKWRDYPSKRSRSGPGMLRRTPTSLDMEFNR